MFCTDYCAVHRKSSILPLHFVQCNRTDLRSQQRFSAPQKAPADGGSTVYTSRLPHKRGGESHHIYLLPVHHSARRSLHHSLQQPRRLGLHAGRCAVSGRDVPHQRGSVLASSVQRCPQKTTTEADG